MDRVTKSYIQAFLESYEIESEGDSKDFEKFCTYCAIKKYYSGSIKLNDLDELVIASAGDTGIDGLAIIVENRLITEIEQIKEILEETDEFELTFVFIQAKDTNKFNRQQFIDFTGGVLELFEEHIGFDPSRFRNKKLKQKAVLITKILADYPVKFKKNPICKLYYIISDFQADAYQSKQENLINKEKRRLEGLKLFNTVEIKIEGTNFIQKSYKNTLSKPKVTLYFPDSTALPKIEGIDEAYIGVLSFAEFKKIVVDEYGNIRRAIFEDNVRYFNESFTVNSDIRDTIKQGKFDIFAVLNNGITIVAKKLRATGKSLVIDDYQIVNGCQTSHIIYQCQDIEGIENLYVTVKIINTNNQEIISNIITATNNQTKVSVESLLALVNFQRSLEAFYNTFKVTGKDGKEENRLYYERQEGQYTNVTQSKIISIKDQAKCFAAMFLDDPHEAVRHYGRVKEKIKSKKTIFVDNHQLLPYYTSALAHYEIHKLLRSKNNKLNRYNKLRFHIIMALKYLIVGFDIPNEADPKINDYCNKIIKVLDKQQQLKKCVEEIIFLIDQLPACDLDDPNINVKPSITNGIIEALRKKYVSSIFP